MPNTGLVLSKVIMVCGMLVLTKWMAPSFSQIAGIVEMVDSGGFAIQAEKRECS